MPYKDVEARRANHREYMRRRYAANPAEQKRLTAANRQRLVAFMRDLKVGPCVDCGGTFPPEAMDFDHLGDDKLGNVARLARLGSRTALLAEIAKCDLVCANCHRVRSRKRRDGEVI